ncbi:MAG: NAD-dependent protein deacylase [Thermoprotei archaeon]|nr:MAG: NAD-dependent protein deacylase [Thermoprotei archaeon]
MVSALASRGVEAIAELIVKSRKAVALTGAGISTESGIPDFRGPQGLWKRVDPKIGTIEFFMEHPDEFWRFQLDRLKEMMKAKPNRAHYALAELEKMGKLSAVITQNVDGLHLKAGSKNVIEIHGNLRTAVCIRCKRVIPIEEALRLIESGVFPPKCEKCGSLLKTGSILFNEPIPEEALTRSYIEAETCDFMMAIGTSLQVYPAAYLPVLAKRRGAKLAIINMEPTPLDDIADVVVHGKVGDVLESVLKLVKNMVEGRGQRA